MHSPPSILNLSTFQLVSSPSETSDIRHTAQSQIQRNVLVRPTTQTMTLSRLCACLVCSMHLAPIHLPHSFLDQQLSQQTSFKHIIQLASQMSATELAENEDMLLNYVLEQSRVEQFGENVVANSNRFFSGIAPLPLNSPVRQQRILGLTTTVPAPRAANQLNHAPTRPATSSTTTTSASSSSSTAPLTCAGMDREFRRFIIQSLPKTRFAGSLQAPILVKYIIREDVVGCLFEFTSAFAQYLLTRAFEGWNQLPDLGIPLGSSQDYPFSPHQIHTQWPNKDIYDNTHGHNADMLNDMYENEDHHGANMFKLFYSGHTIRLRTLREYHQPNYTQKGAVMPPALVQYFFDQFQAIAPSKLPSELNDQAEHAVLGAILKHWLEWLLNESRRRSRSRGRDSRAEAQEIILIDLWNVIHDSMDPDSKSMRELFKYLHVSFDAKMTAADPWTYRYYGYQPPSTMTSYETILIAETSNVQTEMNKLNARSWYMNPQQLLSYAQAFARGQCHEEDAFLPDLRQHNVHILQYHGLHTNLVSNPPEHRDWGQRRSPRAFVSFMITDAAGVDFRFLYSMGDGHEGEIQSLETGEDLFRISSYAGTISIQYCAPLNPPTSLFNQFQMNYNPAQQHLLTQLRAFKPLMDEVIQARKPETYRSSVNPVTVGSRDPSDHARTSYGTWSRINYLQCHQLDTRQTANEFEHGFKQEFLFDIFGSIFPTLDFARLGPTAYEENHPLAVKRQFHSHFMDTCLIDSGLQPLPTVLSQLISDYYTIPIPFISEEAEKQMSGFAPVIKTKDRNQLLMSNPVDMAVGSLMGGWIKLDNQPQWIEWNQEIKDLQTQK